VSATSAYRHRSKRGQSLVEFALVLPVFMLVLAGILDFGFMLYSRMTVINAAREGARAAVVSIDDPTAIPSLVHNRVLAVAGGLTATPSDTAACIADTAQHATCDFVAGGQPNPLPGDSVRVTVNYTYSTFFPLLFGATFNLASTVQMVIE
jgi:Flp pilus assembly protein TadG